MSIIVHWRCINNKIHLRETAWHNEINGILSLDFWNNSYRLVTELKFENKIKWLQLQIIRGCLKTNNTVHHFKPNVSPLCHYCGTLDERILHLFYGCHVVKRFWEDLQTNLLTKHIYIPKDRNKLLFGVHDEKASSVTNYVILAAKQYIWRKKFRHPNADLSVAAFCNILKYKTAELKAVAELLKNDEMYDTWNDVYLLL